MFSQGVVNVYGQTELGAVTSGLSTASLGSILPGIKLKVGSSSDIPTELANTSLKPQIVDPDTGEKLGPGKIGEICVLSGHSQMLGYLQQEPGGAGDFLDAEGFGQSGDIGFYSEEGNVFFVDRMKEIIKYGYSRLVCTRDATGKF
jgi:acyl-CoA synthetase (AMP-forming)/AMP-acid ligase II